MRCRKFLRKLGLYVRNIGVALDQLVNAFLGGDPDETLSSRLGKCKRWFCKVLCFTVGVLFFNLRHCQENIEPDEGSRDIFKRWLRDE